MKLFARGAAAALLALVFPVTGCFRSHDTFNVEMQASEDLQCPRGSLVAEDLGGDFFVIKGCDKEARYSCVKDSMGNFECQRKDVPEKQ